MPPLLNLQGFLKDGTESSQASLGDPSVDDARDVVYDPEYQQEVALSEEVKKAVQKRFRNKATVYDSFSFFDIVIWCLSTRGYSFNSSKVNGVSDSDVLAVWEFVDTLSVSSSGECRSLVERGKGSRSSQEFHRFIAPRPSRVLQRQRPAASSAPPTQVAYSREDQEGYRTLEDMIVSEYTCRATESENPLEVIMSMRRSILDSLRAG